MATVLTIAGFDPSSGAGVTADVLVFAAHGLVGRAAITALTVQSAGGVRGVHAVDRRILAETLACLHAEHAPAGIKIGMLANAANVGVVCDYVELVRRAGVRVPVVLDPVLRSSSGVELLDEEGISVLGERLLPLVDWVTPNLDELAVLSGRRVSTAEDLVPAAVALQAIVARRCPESKLRVFATGGHLVPPDDVVVDASGDAIWLRGARIEAGSSHGTGCALSSAFLSRIVLGEGVGDAARGAKGFVAGALWKDMKLV